MSAGLQICDCGFRIEDKEWRPLSGASVASVADEIDRFLDLLNPSFVEGGGVTNECGLPLQPVKSTAYEAAGRDGSGVDSICCIFGGNGRVLFSGETESAL